MIRTAHLNQERFRTQAEEETSHILDAHERQREISRLCDKYLLSAMDDPIMRADAHPYRIRKLMPGEIEVIPFIFIAADIGNITCTNPESPSYNTPWQDFFSSYLTTKGGQTYLKRHGDIYFGFPECSLDDSLRWAAAIHKSLIQHDIMRMMTLSTYWFEDIVQNPAHPWPDDRLGSFTTQTRTIAFEDYIKRFPHLM